jgi:hypothetical protein
MMMAMALYIPKCIFMIFCIQVQIGTGKFFFIKYGKCTFSSPYQIFLVIPEHTRLLVPKIVTNMPLYFMLELFAIL